MGLDIDFRIKIINSNEISKLYGLRVSEIVLELGHFNDITLKNWIQKQEDYEGDIHTGELYLDLLFTHQLYNYYRETKLKTLLDNYYELKEKYEELGCIILLYVSISE